MSTLGFDSYVEPLKLYLQKFREAMKGEKGIGGTVTTADGLSEELTEEAFTNQLPAGLITTDGQQQNVMVYTTSYQQISGVQQIQFSWFWRKLSIWERETENLCNSNEETVLMTGEEIYLFVY